MARRRRTAVLVSSALLALLLAPASCSAVRDLRLLAGADGAAETEEARLILLADLAQGSLRALQADFLLGEPAPPAGILPVIALSPPRTDLARGIPTCPARTFTATPRRPAPAGVDPFDVGGFGRTDAAGLPDGFRRPNRGIAIESARRRLAARRLGTARLVALNACVRATPFAARCGRSFVAAELGATATDLIAQLAEDGIMRVERGRACWLWPEFLTEPPARTPGPPPPPSGKPPR
jgi:hypothetical protein